jgi:hypothetical protein
MYGSGSLDLPNGWLIHVTNDLSMSPNKTGTFQKTTYIYLHKISSNHINTLKQSDQKNVGMPYAPPKKCGHFPLHKSWAVSHHLGVSDAADILCRFPMQNSYGLNEHPLV